ncbi:hypothetical protein BFC21_01090 [Pseudomonas sp. TMW 2.1634]|nr:hypothetical protein BFC21_01090 [Pseudomonas sp. TMW 2.1634]
MFFSFIIGAGSVNFPFQLGQTIIYDDLKVRSNLLTRERDCAINKTIENLLTVDTLRVVL